MIIKWRAIGRRARTIAQPSECEWSGVFCPRHIISKSMEGRKGPRTSGGQCAAQARGAAAERALVPRAAEAKPLPIGGQEPATRSPCWPSLKKTKRSTGKVD